MKILSVCPSIPAVDAKGFQVQAFYRISHLSRRHEVTVICFGSGEIDSRRKTLLTDMGIKVFMIRWHIGIALFQLFKGVFNSRMPLQCALFMSPIFSSKINEVLRTWVPDVIHVTTIRVLRNLPEIETSIVLDMVDSMGLNFRRRVYRAPWWTRPFWSVEQTRVTSFERAAAEKAMVSFVVSSVDRDEIGCGKVRVLSLGIDGNNFHKGVASPDPIIVLTGNMSYRPNIEAAIWFAHNCWPAISAAIPNALFVIAGNRPASIVRKLCVDPSVRVIGSVDVMADVIRQAQVAVAPMQSGSGMQFKILEAMSCGVPVVTTRLGLGDIKAKPNSEIMVADTPRDFVTSVTNLLLSSELRAFVGDSARNFVSRYHTWCSINSEFERAMVDEFNIRTISKESSLNS